MKITKVNKILKVFNGGIYDLDNNIHQLNYISLEDITMGNYLFEKDYVFIMYFSIKYNSNISILI